MGQEIHYLTLGLCAAGCAGRILLAGYYRLQLSALKSMKTTKNKGMAKMKEQFILRYQAMLGVQNVEAFVGRFLSEKRWLGIPLAVWNNMHAQLVSACLLLGSADALYRCIQLGDTKDVLMAMFHGIWTGTLLLLVDAFCLIPSKCQAIREGMEDYLENYLKVRLEHEYEVWGKNKEELRQTKQVLEAQLRIEDEKEYKRSKRREEKESKIRKDVSMLKKEVEERRKQDALAAVSKEPEKRVNRQLDALIEELSLNA